MARGKNGRENCARRGAALWLAAGGIGRAAGIWRVWAKKSVAPIITHSRFWRKAAQKKRRGAHFRV
ncbi:MAG: hypothetical protein ACR2P5_09160 [Gammaproteobacteria bacterium]